MIRLSDYKRTVTSQDGEDGIVEFIFDKLGVDKGQCVEFGAWDGKHLSNTWNLWHNRGWRALLIEGDSIKAQELRRSARDFPEVTCLSRFVGSEGPDSLDAILGEAGVAKDFDLLSIDVDGDDHYIWRGLQGFQPKVVVIECNPTFPPHVDFVDYPNGKNFGASALAQTRLAKEKRYRLAGCTRTNLFFVTDEVLEALGMEEPALESVFCYDSLTYAIAPFKGGPLLTRRLPYLSTGSIRGISAQTLPRPMPEGSGLYPVVIVDRGFLLRWIPGLVPAVRLLRTVYHATGRLIGRPRRTRPQLSLTPGASEREATNG